MPTISDILIKDEGHEISSPVKVQPIQESEEDKDEVEEAQ